MICLYDSKCIDFNNNGLVVLDSPITAIISEELNGQFELELEYPLDERGKWQKLTEENILKADGQLFRIYHKIKNLTSIKVNARHIFYDLADNFIEILLLTNNTGANALNSVISNTQYPHSFISMGDVVGSYTANYTRKNPVESILGTDGIVNTWGGELVRDNFTIKLLQARGLDRGVLVSYGKNIVGVEETLDTDGICTRLMPIGKDDLILPEKYINSQYINNFPHPKIKVVEFSDCENETTLRAAAIKYMVDSKIDIPAFNYKIDFLELSKTEEYKNYALLESVWMGDTVTIKHSKLNISLKAKVIKIVKNCITNRIEKVELGSFKPNLASGINKSIQTVRAEIVDTKSSLQLAIDNATTQINNALGGYVVKRNGELLIMDTENINTAVKVWRWNVNGLGYSGTGYNGPFRTAITADGHIVADFIDTGTLTASIIKAGILKSFNNAVIFNLDNGTLKLGDKLDFDGTNLILGSGVTLSWGQVTGTPTILDANTVTQISNNAISTATINVNQLFGNIANLADSVNIGSPSSNAAKKVYFSNYNNNGTYYGASIGLSDSGNMVIENSSQRISIVNYDDAILLYENGIHISTNVLGGEIKLTSDKIGFFGSTPYSKQNAAQLSGAATLAQVITKVNGLMSQLANYGLISTS